MATICVVQWPVKISSGGMVCLCVRSFSLVTFGSACEEGHKVKKSWWLEHETERLGSAKCAKVPKQTSAEHYQPPGSGVRDILSFLIF